MGSSGTTPGAAVNSFLTGSCAYGTPTHHSDIDLVVLVDAETLACLRLASKECKAIHGGGSGEDDPQIGQRGASLLFGETNPEIGQRALNLIALLDADQFATWYYCTEFLKTKAPVTRQKAKDFIKKKLKALDEGTFNPNE